MFVALIGINLREYNDLSIADCAQRIGKGVGRIQGEIDYGKDLNIRSGHLKGILSDLFTNDILRHSFNSAQKSVIALLSLTPAEWYDAAFIIDILDGVRSDKAPFRAIKVLLKFGWLQGSLERIAIHPLISEFLSEQPVINSEPRFHERILENYLGLPDKFFGKERLLINKVLSNAHYASAETKISIMLAINHGGYRGLFKENYPHVKAAYFIYVNHEGKRYFEYRNLVENETHSLIEVVCQEYEAEQAVLLGVYNTGILYALLKCKCQKVQDHIQRWRLLSSGQCELRPVPYD